MSSTSAVVIRTATHRDEPDVRRCVWVAHGGHQLAAGDQPELDLDDLVTLIAAGATHVAADGDTGRVVGVLVAWIENDHVHIEHLAVDPDAQRRGIGSDLLDLAADLARAAERTELRLVTNETMTDNLAFYPRRGFVESYREVEQGVGRVHFRRLLA